MRNTLLTLILLAACTVPAAAQTQTDFTTLPLAPGDKVYITDSSGIEVDRFQVEGAARNVTVDYTASRVSGYLRIITSSGVIGQCAHSDTKPNTVIIDQIYWNTATDLEKEFVVFHELGHCVLNREHTDASDNQGDCVSIMTSGTGSCHIEYTVATRTALLDELFNP